MERVLNEMEQRFKTNYRMRYIKNQKRHAELYNVQVDGEIFQRVDAFTYLGIKIICISLTSTLKVEKNLCMERGSYESGAWTVGVEDQGRI